MSWKNRGPMFCRTCEAHQVKTEIYFDNEHKSQTGKSIPMEKATKQPHQCQFSPYAQKQQQQNYSRQEQKEFIDNRGYMTEPKLQYKTTSPYEQLPPEAQKFISEPQNYNEYFRTLETKLDNIGIAIGQLMGMLETHLNSRDATPNENAKLRQQVTELEEVIKRQGLNFKPANKVDIEPEAMAAEAENEHVRRVMRKGEEDEELEI